MVACRIRCEELAVQHVREPCQGMPVVGIDRLKRPGDAALCQSRLHMAVLGDIFVIIITDEFKAAHLPEYGSDNQDKKKGNNKIAMNRL
jgi:hypothetical protein